MLILLAEDNKDHAELTKVRLEQAKGYKVEVAHDGEECLKKAKEKYYDVILSDYAMPKMNGLELLGKLKEAGIDIPVVVLTGHGDEKIVVRVMKSGAYDYVIKEPDFSYLDILPFVIEDAKKRHLLQMENLRLSQQLVKKNKELEQANIKLRELSITDGLTKIYNYRFFQEALDMEFKRSKRYAQTLSCIILDIDDFKKINDIHGHRAGDFVLIELVSLIKKNIRETDIFARYGGEEFTAIFAGKAAQEAVPHLDTYRKIIESTPFVVRGKGRRKSSAEYRGKIKSAGRKGINITVSIGVASPNRRLTSPEKVLKAADKILYKAKKSGRNRVKS